MPNYNIIFSPTGGTKKVSEILKNEFGGNWRNIDLCVAECNLNIPILSQDDICIIAVPSFGGRVPELNVERIRKLSGGGAKAILVCVYGNRAYEDTLTELKAMVEKTGFKCIAAVSAIAEHSIARQFATGRPDDKDSEVLKDFARQIKKKISCEDFELHSIIPGSYNEYKDRGKSTFKPETNNTCIECGVCAKGCPVSAIDFENLKVTDNEKCISCMKCISVCPINARALNENVLNTITERLSKVCAERRENELFI